LKSPHSDSPASADSREGVDDSSEPSAALAMLLSARGPSNAVSRIRGGLSRPVQVISDSGRLDVSGASAVANSIGDQPPRVVASVGGQHHGRRVLNALYGTNFDSSVQLGAKRSSGAWLATSPNAPGCLVLQTEGAWSNSAQRSPVDSCKLNCFALEVADAVVIHSPCVSPSRTLVKEMYEGIFSRYIEAAAASGTGTSPTLLAHVSDADDALADSDIRSACMEAWSAAVSNSALQGTSFSEVFDLEVVRVPAESKDAAGFAAAMATLRETLERASSKLAKGSDFTESVSAAWEHAKAVLDDQPSEEYQTDLFRIDRSYENALAKGKEKLRKWGATVASGGLISNFGKDAGKMVEEAMHSFDAGVAACAALGSKALCKEKGMRLIQELHSGAQELLTKQRIKLQSTVITNFQTRLEKVMGRAGEVKEWQQESLRRKASKEFNAGISNLIADSETCLELTQQFSKQLTDLTASLMESPGMKLQALGAMIRKTGKDQKPQRGVHTGVGLSGAIHDRFAGGLGNIQTFAGYQNGLNSAHLMYSNDGMIPDSTGDLPPLFRMQPKLNFDIAL